MLEGSFCKFPFFFFVQNKKAEKLHLLNYPDFKLFNAKSVL